MTFKEYQSFVLTTSNKELSDKEKLVNGVMGLCGESGETIDIVKKWLHQGHELDKEHMKEELGDIAWYLSLTASVLGYDLEDVFNSNVEKLKKRYPNGFEKDKSINR